MTNITVLGGGWSAQTMAADLAIYGWRVSLADFPEYRQNLSWIAGTLEIEKYGAAGIHRRTGIAKLAAVSFDVSVAVKGADLLILAVPAYGHERFFETLAPVLEDGQVVLIAPGNWGALRLKRKLDALRPGNRVIICETDICFGPSRAAESFLGPGRVRVISERKTIRLAAIPASDTGTVLGLLSGPYPELEAAGSVIETSLCNTNPATHAPLMLMNAGWIEHAGEGIMIYRDGTGPAVCRTMDALSTERDTVLRAMGIDLPVVDYDSFQRLSGAAWCRDPCQTAPSELNYRYLTEDIPYGLVPQAELASIAGAAVPVTEAMITLAALANQSDHRSTGITAASLGFTGLDAPAIMQIARTGKGWPQ